MMDRDSILNKNQEVRTAGQRDEYIEILQCAIAVIEHARTSVAKALK